MNIGDKLYFIEEVWRPPTIRVVRKGILMSLSSSISGRPLGYVRQDKKHVQTLLDIKDEIAERNDAGYKKLKILADKLNTKEIIRLEKEKKRIQLDIEILTGFLD